MDDFSDDDFDDLNDNVLQELENNALQATQGPKLGNTRPEPLRPHVQTEARFAHGNGDINYFDDDDLDDTVVLDESAKPPAPPPISHAQRVVPTLTAQQSWNQPSRGQGPSRGSYGVGSQRPLASQRYPPPPPRPIANNRPQAPPSQFARPPIPPATGRYGSGAAPSQAAPGSQHGDIISTLQARVRALETDLFTAKGEASVLRSKFDSARKTHEADVERLKKQNAEQLAKQERMVEAAVAAQRTASTELEFTRQDLQEELNRAKKGRKHSDPAGTTPKKGGAGRSNWHVGDGFDNVEILPSPTRGGGRRGKDTGPVAVPVAERTPTKGKRKRPAFDSPVMALETTDDIVMREDRPQTIEGTANKTRRDALPFNASLHSPLPARCHNFADIVDSSCRLHWTTVAFTTGP